MPLVRSLYEEAFPGGNTFLFCEHPKLPLEPSPELPRTRTVPPSYFSSEELRQEVRNYDAVVIHGMLAAFASAIKRLPPEILVVWCGWGFDYAHLLTGGKEGLLLPDTARICADLRNSRRNLKDWLKALLRLAKRAAGSQAVGEPLVSVAGRINVFSVLPVEEENVRGALPAMRAIYHGLPYQTTEDVLEKGPPRMMGNDILLGNSAAASNNHVDALKLLRETAQDRNVIVPLSYADPGGLYTARVVEEGARLLGDRFKPLTAWMPMERYFAHLSNCGIVIMNHRRQQALGNISAALYKGAKVFLRPENPVYRWYLEMGIKLFPVTELEQPSPAAWQGLGEGDREANRRIVGEFWKRGRALKAIRDLESLLKTRR
ncbi:MAG TPA: TDP-N-acetylfucosamine:lipid II N-acetylfucosaminyltransferase [Verrucomicrobiae bacterium]|nr:TDP-N-acetylfucosamine:lipid II N-acetylfucosaminyltransferase [Verrucomicrobiae bacterium]